jgi:hypothetical protein
MKKRFLGIAIVLISAAMLWQCNIEPAPELSENAKVHLALLPEDASGIVYIDISSIKDSPFFTEVTKGLSRNPFSNQEYREFMEATDFDVREDVDELYMTYSPGEDPYDKKFLVVAVGDFNPEKIMNFIDIKGPGYEFSSSDYNKFKIYGVEGKEMIFSFPDTKILVAGNNQLVKSLLDKFPEKSDKTTKWINKIAKMKYQNGVCVTMDTKLMMKSLMYQINRYQDTPKFEALKSLENIDFSMAIAEKIRFHGTGAFDNAENAQLFYDAFKGLLATAKISVSGDRDLVDLINQLKTDQENSNISFEGELSRSDIEKLKSNQDKLKAI